MCIPTVVVVTVGHTAHLAHHGELSRYPGADYDYDYCYRNINGVGCKLLQKQPREDRTF